MSTICFLLFIPHSSKCNSRLGWSLLSINPELEGNENQQSKCSKGNFSGWTHWSTAEMLIDHVDLTDTDPHNSNACSGEF